MSAGGRDEERRKLADIIQHWNANRLDLFEISQPTEVRAAGAGGARSPARGGGARAGGRGAGARGAAGARLAGPPPGGPLSPGRAGVWPAAGLGAGRAQPMSGKLFRPCGPADNAARN